MGKKCIWEGEAPAEPRIRPRILTRSVSEARLTRRLEMQIRKHGAAEEIPSGTEFINSVKTRSS